MEGLMDQAQRLAETDNEQERKKLIDGLRDLSYSIETPDDTMQRIMYMRWQFHDWPNYKCREILQNIISSMAPESVILLDEMILPDSGVHYQSTQTDLTMMASCASIERTKSMWADLLDSVGLKVEKALIYTPSIYETVMTVVRE
ncbi:hypothetical protein JMJ35_010620 [Cladonia borealis]|uniref:O-methyltransferase C-terminal domain-containing protein n=1 Tax=Cladonia borealis TaxID=184061 RepID=A0AA39QPU3_9LECA|nr:hypothetical protein JMJ35_010620 [Cladonia borealis]